MRIHWIEACPIIRMPEGQPHRLAGAGLRLRRDRHDVPGAQRAVSRTARYGVPGPAVLPVPLHPGRAPAVVSRQKAFQGKTGAGPHGDFIYEFDHVVGELLATLDRLGLAENTIVMVTSDNGPEVTSVVHMREDHDHDHDGARPREAV